jgi:CelD/BcsL family acetyltransferase involved in cellulose biosynthesis
MNEVMALRATPLATGERAGSAARLAVFSDLRSAEPLWRTLECSGAILSPYQRYDWIAAWQRHVGSREGIRPLIAVGTTADGSPQFLLPLGIERRGGVGVARFLGGKHANYNFPPWQPAAAAGMTAAALRSALQQLAADGVDLLVLVNQPTEWEGVSNPLRLIPAHPSPSSGLRAKLASGGEESIKRLLSAEMRGRLRNKERKLAKSDGYRYARLRSSEEVERSLEAFFAQKSARLRERGLADVFAAPGVADFLREACLAGLPDRPVIEVHLLEGGGEVLAVLAGVNDGRRFSSMFNSYTLSEASRWSPGLILLMHVIRDVAERGAGIFDLGVGEAAYKSFFCEEEEELFDSFIPLTGRGHPVAAAIRCAFGLKRRIKQSPALFSVLHKLQKRFARETATR